MGAYHGVKLWDMRVRASARILEKGIQNNLIEEVERHRGHGGSWKDHSMTWAQTERRYWPPWGRTEKRGSAGTSTEQCVPQEP